MNRLLAAALTLPLILGAGAAIAEQVTGTVESVDPNTNTVVVNGVPYIFENGVKLKVADIKVGEKLRLEYDVNTNNVSQADVVK